MKIFVWQDDAKYFIDEDGQFLLTEKPELDFEYDSITYTDMLCRKNNTDILTDSEKQSIDNFIVQFKKTNKKAFCVDDNGNYLGYVDYLPGVNNKVPYPTPDSSFIWSFGKNTWQKKYFYNSTGNQVGAEYSIGFTLKEPPSINHIYSIENDSWILNDVATYERKLYTKIKSLGALFYYMDYAYMDQTFLKDIVNAIKDKAIVDNKPDLQQICDWIIEILDNCAIAQDKKELENHLNEALMLINSKVMLDVSDPVLIKTDTWKSIDAL